MAEVYAARIIGEGGFEKVVALKRMLPTLAEDERFVSMFLDEGRVAANISSPYVVQTMDLGRADDDSLYLVMELVVGVPLSRLIREVLKSGEYVDVDVAVEIVAQAALGLHDAHEATTPSGDPLRIVHRDVSPQNILVDRTGRTRIVDFGVARAMQRSSHTKTGEVKGKMAYFAPEQAAGGSIDRRVDIFALGTVTWELLAGRRLFKSDNPLHTLQKITLDPIPTLREVRPDLDRKISDVVAKALERKPSARYATAREFAQDLRSCLKTSIPPAQVGEYVRRFGGESLEKLESHLKFALSGEFASPYESGSSHDERTPLSTSQIVPTSPTFTQQKILKSKKAIWGAALIALFALIVGVSFAISNDPEVVETPEETTLETTPTLETASNIPPVDDPARGTSAEISTMQSDVEEPNQEENENTLVKTNTQQTMNSRNSRWRRRGGMTRQEQSTMVTEMASVSPTMTETTSTMQAITMQATTMTSMVSAQTDPPPPMNTETMSSMVIRGLDVFDMEAAQLENQ